MFSFFACVLLLLTLIVCRILFKSFINPAAINAFLWFSIIVIHSLVPHGLYELSDEVLLLVVVAVLLFALGGATTEYIFRPGEKLSVVHEGRRVKLFYNLYFVISLLGAPLVFYKATLLASHGTTPSFFVNLRMSLTNENFNGSYGVLAYLTPIAYSGLFLMTVDLRGKVFKLKFFVFLILCLFYATMATGRTFFFILFIPLFSIFIFIKGRKLNPKLLFIGFGSVSVAFVSIGLLMGKLGSDFSQGLSVFWLYLLGGITAFDFVIINEQWTCGCGVNTFRTFYAIISKIGFDLPVVQLIKDYTYVPLPTNVYTVFYPYYIDFGFIFMFFIQFFLGGGQTYLYSRAVSGDPKYILLASVGMYPLMMQWFQDQYFSLLTMWIVFFVLLTIPFNRIKVR